MYTYIYTYIYIHGIKPRSNQDQAKINQDQTKIYQDQTKIDHEDACLRRTACSDPTTQNRRSNASPRGMNSPEARALKPGSPSSASTSATASAAARLRRCAASCSTRVSAAGRVRT